VRTTPGGFATTVLAQVTHSLGGSADKQNAPPRFRGHPDDRQVTPSPAVWRPRDFASDQATILALDSTKLAWKNGANSRPGHSTLTLKPRAAVSRAPSET
jgi:hypothetical protein